MRMSHIYQPLMIRTLLNHGGQASIRQIASQFLHKDESQLEYYEEITKNMPGKVLSKHGIVAREDDRYRLLLDLSTLSSKDLELLILLCDDKMNEYVEKRGASVFAHRNLAKGYVPGSIRYEVLRRAGGRCELCGVSHDDRALEVDHIVPRRQGGLDDVTNYQALCWKCNANKGARDATDFRRLREAYGVRESNCVFCEIGPKRAVEENALAVALRDGFPVTPMHTLVISKRHVQTYFDLYTSERRAIDRLVDSQRAIILEKDPAVVGFNVGLNAGEAAGQTVMHCHVHLIPRRNGDVSNPRGGIRNVLPGAGDY
jgi:diadenosine tetraphosphate (Ap4A) HIT family hydrolase